jgi:hypothetical protein
MELKKIILTTLFGFLYLKGMEIYALEINKHTLCNTLAYL